MSEAKSRREFLERAALGTLGAAAVGSAAMGATALAGEAAAAGDAAGAEGQRVAVDGSVDVTDRIELDIPAVECPYEAAYQVDVLVVGCGMAGLHAAAGAADAGASVLVVDKATPGYGGLTPFAGGTAYFDAEANDLDTTLKAMSLQNEYLCNQNWLRAWAEDSAAYIERDTAWGLLATYPEPVDTKYWVDGYFEGSAGDDDQRGYAQDPEVAPLLRQQRFTEVLDSYGIQHLDHTMVCDVVEADGRVAGAVALHVPSGQTITITCKAAILCSGSGTVKPAGYPLGGAAFDGVYIAYKHGLPVAGMEFEDYHLAWSEKPGCVLTTSGWDYSEPFRANPNGWPAGTAEEDMVTSGYLQKINYQYSTAGLATPDRAHYGAKHTPTTGWNAPGAAPGFPLHMTGGVFCGWDDTHGATALPGLYGAGDGSLGSFIGGACYYGISGLTTSSCGVQGYRAGSAAAEYAAGIDFAEPPADEVAAVNDEVLGPLGVEVGFNPAWVVEQLQNAIANTNVIFVKSEATLNAALVLVEYIRDNYLPKMKALSTHDLRLCCEARAKVAAMEIKLRAGLARKESRGFHYRADYPYRDDQYLGIFTATKADDGMSIDFVPMPEDWVGDTSADYAARYPGYRFYGETEAKGLPEQESKGW